MRVFRSLLATGLALGFAASANAQFAYDNTTTWSNPNPRSSDDYMLDDGTGETNLGWSATAPGAIVSLNEFTVQAGFDVLTGISIAPGTNPAGSLGITLLVFSGDAANAGPGNLLHQQDVTLTGSASDQFQKFSVPNVNLGNVGDTFLMGFYAFSDQTQFPHRIDTTTPQGMSWVSGAPNAFDPADPNAGASGAGGIPLSNLSGFSFNGNFMIRGNAIPAPGALALLGLGGLIAARRRR